MIICGFPGTGKSTAVRLHKIGVDLESTPFSRNGQWLLYAEVAKHMSDNGDIVFVSTHKPMLDALEQVEAKYTVVIPPFDDKEHYYRRYVNRGNNADFCDKIYSNWDKWIADIRSGRSFLKTVVTLPEGGCIAAWLEEYLRLKE